MKVIEYQDRARSQPSEVITKKYAGEITRVFGIFHAENWHAQAGGRWQGLRQVVKKARNVPVPFVGSKPDMRRPGARQIVGHHRGLAISGWCGDPACANAKHAVDQSGDPGAPDNFCDVRRSQLCNQMGTQVTPLVGDAALSPTPSPRAD
ncbi:hypothetical protein QEO92_29300 (plasmid) [Neorhizobium petrolearium]|uniref:Uncharacterized protein n=1 Tax=Neorhizobium petrolearium TaxID=515361 RepID=A0ABY8MBK8_9HYPH|nr:hypothetical protein [Neorhizobium petrolearium]WGI71436.1 hypothetical protein QEO92_29300 [Neorhizobium petrolearium]